MFAKFITRLKLRRIVRKLQKQRDLMRRELGLSDQSENGQPAVSEHNIQYITRIMEQSDVHDTMRDLSRKK